MLKQGLLSGPVDKCEGQDMPKGRTVWVGVRKAQGNGQAQKPGNSKAREGGETAQRRGRLDRIVATCGAERTVPIALIRAELLGPPTLSKKENGAPASPQPAF